MHWGTYSQWGIVESWSICSEDEDWCRRSNKNYIAYKNDYEKLKTTFNPTKFNPEKWAEAASKIFPTSAREKGSIFVLGTLNGLMLLKPVTNS